jgi:hypothetical protein
MYNDERASKCRVHPTHHLPTELNLIVNSIVIVRFSGSQTLKE